MSRRRVGLAAVLLWAVVAYLLAFAGPARAAPGTDFYGLNVQPLFKLSAIPPTAWGGYLDQIAAGGLTIGRVDAAWAWAEPTAPSKGVHAYTWNPSDRPRESLDAMAIALAQRGIRMLSIFDVAPQWASGSGTAVAPSRYGDFAAFSAAYAARYGADGTFWKAHPELPYLPVEDFELWTEANSSLFWTGNPDPAEYLSALGTISQAVHQADPGAHVLASIGWQNFDGYVAALYAAGLKGMVDGIGFHPYAPDAPGVLSLVARLRQVMVGAGDPTLPIEVTEIGQPVTYGSTSARFAYDGMVGDAARAATITMTGDALARSDCGVTNFLMYGIVGTETDAEPISEGYMGAFRIADGKPDVTGNALFAAAKRWHALRRSGVSLCSTRTTPLSRKVLMDLKVTKGSRMCANGVTTYYGNPLEGALLTLRTKDGRIVRVATDSFGQAQVCIPNGKPIYQYTVRAEIPNVAISTTYHCDVIGGTCTPWFVCLVSRNSSCPWHVALKVVAAGTSRARLRALLTCGPNGLRRPCKLHTPTTFRIFVRRHGRHGFGNAIGKVVLRTNRTRTIRLRGGLRRGDQVLLSHRRDKVPLPLIRGRATTSLAATRKRP